MFKKKTAFELFEKAQSVFTKTLDQLDKALARNAEELSEVGKTINDLNEMLSSQYAVEAQLRKDSDAMRAMQRRVEQLIDG